MGWHAMAYLSLYRKWRPQAFSEVVGQEHVVRTLTNALETGRVAHAYLFSGPRGTGKTTFARLLAKGLNCVQGPTGSPCNKCDICTRIAKGTAVDVIEIDGASNRGIDEIRELRDRVKYAPTEGRYKVYIIDEVHMLTNEAFNALLKVLEEPPAHVVFVFATTEEHKLPATILSRCQKFDFRRFSPGQLLSQLEKVAKSEGVNADPQALALIARHAEGGMRDALAILDQCLAANMQSLTPQNVSDVLGVVRREALLELSGYILKRNIAEGLRCIHALLDEGVEARQLLRDLAAYFRDLVLLKAAPGVPELITAQSDDCEQQKQQAQMVGLRQLLAAVEILAASDADLRWSANPAMASELVLVKTINAMETLPEGGQPASDALLTLEQRISALEQNVQTLLQRTVAAQGASVATQAATQANVATPAATQMTVAPTTQSTQTQRSTSAPRQVSQPAKAVAVPSSAAGSVSPVDSSPAPEVATKATPATGVSPATPVAAVGRHDQQHHAVAPQARASGTGKTVAASAAVTHGGDNTELLAKLQAQWPAVLAALKEERMISLEAYLRVGTPGAMNGRTVVIYFSPGHKFHQANVDNQRHKSIVERAISRVLGVDVTISTTVGNPPPPVQVKAAPGNAEQPSSTVDVSAGTSSQEMAASSEELVTGSGQEAANESTAPNGSDNDALQSPAVQKALQYLGGKVVLVKEQES